MYEASLFYGEKARRESRVLERLGLKPEKYILVTIHRAENTDDPSRLQAIVEGLCEVGKSIPVVFPVHPRTRKALERYGLLKEVVARLRLIEPVGYLDMVMLEQNACLIATDSGGVQKEAFFYRVPCVTLRGETEWVELVELGWNRLVYPHSTNAVANGITEGLASPGGMEGEPYGNGRSGELIVQRLLAV